MVAKVAVGGVSWIFGQDGREVQEDGLAKVGLGKNRSFSTSC